MKTAVVVLLIVAMKSAKAGTTIACPEALKVNATIQPPAGWEVIPPKWKSSLDGITIYSGHPKELGSLVPDELPTKDGYDIAQWDTDDNTWLECRYTGTHYTIARKLPKGLKSCKAHYKHQDYGLGPLERFECK